MKLYPLYKNEVKHDTYKFIINAFFIRGKIFNNFYCCSSLLHRLKEKTFLENYCISVVMRYEPIKSIKNYLSMICKQYPFAAVHRIPYMDLLTYKHQYCKKCLI